MLAWQSSEWPGWPQKQSPWRYATASAIVSSYKKITKMSFIMFKEFQYVNWPLPCNQKFFSRCHGIHRKSSLWLETISLLSTNQGEYKRPGPKWNGWRCMRPCQGSKYQGHPQSQLQLEPEDRPTLWGHRPAHQYSPHSKDDQQDQLQQSRTEIEMGVSRLSIKDP